jgi:hypothetical protein
MQSAAVLFCSALVLFLPSAAPFSLLPSDDLPLRHNSGHGGINPSTIERLRRSSRAASPRRRADGGTTMMPTATSLLLGKDDEGGGMPPPPPPPPTSPLTRVEDCKRALIRLCDDRGGADDGGGSPTVEDSIRQLERLGEELGFGQASSMSGLINGVW